MLLPSKPTKDQAWVLAVLYRAVAIAEALSTSQGEAAMIWDLADRLVPIWAACPTVKVTAYGRIGDQPPKILVIDSDKEIGLSGTFIWDDSLKRFRFEELDPDPDDWDANQTPASAGRFQAECLRAAEIGGTS